MGEIIGETWNDEYEQGMFWSSFFYGFWILTDF